MRRTSCDTGAHRRWRRHEASEIANASGALRVEMRPGGVSVSGPIDAASAPVLAMALVPMIVRDRQVRIDMHQVTFMDAAGAHVLADATKALGRDGRLVLQRPSRPVTRVLEILGVAYTCGFKPATTTTSNADHPACGRRMRW
jgi:anti-anti-sigma factor